MDQRNNSVALVQGAVPLVQSEFEFVITVHPHLQLLQDERIVRSTMSSGLDGVVSVEGLASGTRYLIILWWQSRRGSSVKVEEVVRTLDGPTHLETKLGPGGSEEDSLFNMTSLVLGLAVATFLLAAIILLATLVKRTRRSSSSTAVFVCLGVDTVSDAEDVNDVIERESAITTPPPGYRTT